MNRRRVVLDTNVIVSAAIKPRGSEDVIVGLVAAREIALYVSATVIAEYEAVLARRKFAHLDPVRIARFLQLLKAEATMVAPGAPVTESAHDPDNRFLECAEAADAEYLVTGNLRHFPKRWKSTSVVNAREFLNAVGL